MIPSRLPTVTVLIPALDEERSLGLVLDDLRAAGEAGRSARRFELREVVVADNGSRDRTGEVARAHGATVVTEARRGYGAACLAGMAHVARDPCDILAFVDADRSDDATQLPELLTPILEGHADLVIGSRVLGEREAGSLSPVQSFGNGLAAVLLRVLYGGRFSDLGPFRAIRWAALEALEMRDRDYGWTVEMQARALKAGLRCAEVPVRYRRRRVGASKVSGTVRGVVGAGWKILFTIAKVRLGG